MPSEENQIMDIMEKLNSEKVPHMVIGGVAAILFGVERPTYDIDIAVPEDLAALESVIGVLKKMGYDSYAQF